MAELSGPIPLRGALQPVGLWDHAKAVEARDDALLRVQASSVPWRTIAWDVLMELARERTTLTSDDLMEEMDRRGVSRPVEARAVGPVMLRAIREKVLIPIGYTRGRDARHHGDVARLYRIGMAWTEAELREAWGK